MTRSYTSVPVARVADLPPGGGLTVRAADRTVALFDVDGQPVAYDGRCRHKGGPIGDGFVRGGIVSCPLHWWRYDLRTGELVGHPSVRLERYATEVRDDIVFVSVPSPEPAAPPTSIRERLLARARVAGDGQEGP